MEGGGHLVATEADEENHQVEAAEDETHPAYEAVSQTSLLRNWLLAVTDNHLVRHPVDHFLRAEHEDRRDNHHQSLHEGVANLGKVFAVDTAPRERCAEAPANHSAGAAESRASAAHNTTHI